MICNKCGQQNEDNVFFCRFCGAMLRQPESQPDWEADSARSIAFHEEEARRTFVQETVGNEKNEAFTVADREVKTDNSVHTEKTVPTYDTQNQGAPVQPSASGYGAPASSSTQGYGMPVYPSTPGYSAPVPPMGAMNGMPYSGGIPARSSSDGIGMAVAALACGISAIVIPYIGLIVGILAIIFGCVAKHKGNTSPMATAGIVCGAVGIAVGLFWIVACAVIIEEATGIIYNSYPFYY